MFWLQVHNCGVPFIPYDNVLHMIFMQQTSDKLI